MLCWMGCYLSYCRCHAMLHDISCQNRVSTQNQGSIIGSEPEGPGLNSALSLVMLDDPG